MTTQRAGRTTSSIEGGMISISDGWSLRGGSFSIGFAWVSGGKFSIPIGIMPGADLLSSVALVAGAPTMSQPSAAGLGAGAFVAGGLFTLTGTPAAAAITTPAASITGGQFSTTARNIPGGAFSAAASLNAGFAGDGPAGGILSAGATMVGGLFAATQNGAPLTSTASVVGGAPFVPYTFARVALQIPGNGTNNSTSIVDVSSNGLTITRSGSPVISTAASVYGGASVRFNAATTDALSINNAVLGVTTEDFWMEGWFKFFTQNPSTTLYINYNHDNITYGPGGGSNHASIRTYGGKLRFVLYAYPSANEQYYAAADDVTITLTDFNHYAAGRVNGELAVWVNGVMYQMTPFTGGSKNIGTRSIRSLGNYVHIGARLRETGYFDNGIDAYMDDFRFVKATPPWGLGNFTPSGPHPTS